MEVEGAAFYTWWCEEEEDEEDDDDDEYDDDDDKDDEYDYGNNDDKKARMKYNHQCWWIVWGKHHTIDFARGLELSINQSINQPTN